MDGPKDPGRLHQVPFVFFKDQISMYEDQAAVMPNLPLQRPSLGPRQSRFGDYDTTSPQRGLFTVDETIVESENAGRIPKLTGEAWKHRVSE